MGNVIRIVDHDTRHWQQELDEGLGRAALEGEARYREISRAAAAAVTGGWRAVAVAVLAVAKRLEELGGRQPGPRETILSNSKTWWQRHGTV